MEERKKRFFEMKTLADLASVLGIKESVVTYFLKEGVVSRHYTCFAIPKKNGGLRIIEAPNKQLKYIQKKLNAILEYIYQPKISTHGYVKTKSVVTNAYPHIGKAIVVNLDIEDFFSSIHFGRILGLFQKQPFNFNKTIAKSLATFVCYNRRLPQGAPTSPVISNFIARTLDNDLIKLCARYKLIYTRYCDDITISTKAVSLPESILNSEDKLGNELLEVLRKNNFKINFSKVRVQRKASRQMVTGLVVNEKPNLLNKKYRHLRTVLYYTFLNGLEQGARKNNFLNDKGKPDVYRFCMWLLGSINYCKMVMGIYSSKYQRLAYYYNAIVEEAHFFVPENTATLLHNYVFVVESGEIAQQGTAFYVKNLGLVSCLHIFWDISKEVDVKILQEIIEKFYVFLPSNKKRYNLKLKKVCEMEDLVLLDIQSYSANGGFEVADKRSLFAGNKIHMAAGYPGYSDKSKNLSEVKDLSITQARENHGQELYVVDKSFYAGASGGPVLDSDGKVLGVIDRGNEYGKEEEHFSAFCAIWKLLDK